MKKNIHLPSKLSRILCDIEDKRISRTEAYTDACVDYSAHGLDMPDSLAEYHIENLENEIDWHNERLWNAHNDHQPLYDDRG